MWIQVATIKACHHDFLRQARKAQEKTKNGHHTTRPQAIAVAEWSTPQRIELRAARSARRWVTNDSTHSEKAIAAVSTGGAKKTIATKIEKDPASRGGPVSSLSTPIQPRKMPSKRLGTRLRAAIVMTYFPMGTRVLKRNDSRRWNRMLGASTINDSSSVSAETSRLSPFVVESPGINVLTRGPKPLSP
jgi:hypothetical protein